MQANIQVLSVPRLCEIQAFRSQHHWGNSLNFMSSAVFDDYFYSGTGVAADLLITGIKPAAELSLT